MLNDVWLKIAQFLGTLNGEKPACRRAGKGRGDERVPGRFFICPGEACLHPGLCGLHTGIVPYGAFEGERGAEMGREDGCSAAVNWKLNQVQGWGISILQPF